MEERSWYDKGFERAKNSFRFKLTYLENKIMEAVVREMNKKGISRTTLADKMGVTKSYVSKLLNNGSNVTIKKLLQIGEALGCNVDVSFLPREENIVHQELTTNVVYMDDYKDNKISATFETICSENVDDIESLTEVG
jgi:transcriptional regulator with XRE-family HTH domain